jgi:hypothetical protein
MAAVGVLLAGAGTWLATAPGGAAVSPGEGSAGAFTASVIPRAGSLAIGVTFGEALAGHTNGTAKAQSQAIDLGAIGTSLTSYNCGKPPSVQPDQIPQPLIVETGDPNASTGVTQTEEGGAFSKFGKAAATPYSEAVTTSAPFAVAGVISIGGGISKSWSGIVHGERQSGASTDLSGITFPGGVSMSGLHWDVVDQSTGKQQKTGTFSIGKATIGGATIPTTNPAQTLSQLNSALAPLGLQLVGPSTHTTSGTEYEDPLQINVIPSSARDSALNTVLTGIQPIRQQVVAATLNAFCNADTFVTVADVAIAAISGGGSMNISLGGVQAKSGDTGSNGFDLSLGTPQLGASTLGSPALGDSGSALSTSSGLPGSPSLGAGTDTGSSASPGAASSPAGPATSAPPRAVAVEPASAITGKRGGALAIVGLAGLGLLGLIAEGDRRKMRRAQRTITFEE